MCLGNLTWILRAQCSDPTVSGLSSCLNSLNAVYGVGDIFQVTGGLYNAASSQLLSSTFVANFLMESASVNSLSIVWILSFGKLLVFRHLLCYKFNKKKGWGGTT